MRPHRPPSAIGLLPVVALTAAWASSGCTLLVGMQNASADDAPSGAKTGGGDDDPGCITDEAFFEDQVAPILVTCKGCHVEEGLAAHTRMVFSPEPEAVDVDFAVLRDIGTLSSIDDPLYIQKPTLRLPHVGGELLAEGDPEVAVLREMTHRFRQPGACEDPGPLTCEDLPIDVQPMVRRLSNVELERTLRDAFAFTELPGLQQVANETRNLFDNQALSSSPTTLGTEYDHANAQAVAQAMAADLDSYLSCDPAEGVACGLTFVQEMGRTLFRRPLSTQEEDLFLSFFESGPAADDGFSLAAEMAVQAMLESPAFLYRLELGVDDGAELTQLTAYETASRLSYFLWGTAPDAELLDAADTGELATLSGVEAQVDRMLEDDRATDGLMHLFRAWLDLEAVRQAQKPAELGFDDGVREGLEQESLRFIRDIVLAEDATLETLLTSDETFVNANIAALYGLDVPADVDADGFARVTHVEPRFGVLTQGGFLASRGHPDQPSPIKRARFILERLMCFEIGSPPPEAEGAEVELEGEQTNRQATDALTLSGTCRGCHSIINPIGFTFERYGTTGAMRADDNGLPIDDSGHFAATELDGAGGLARFLAESPMVQRCVARRFSQYALGHSLPGGECFVSDVEAEFEASGHNLIALVRAIATHPEFAFGTVDKSFAGGMQ